MVVSLRRLNHLTITEEEHTSEPNKIFLIFQKIIDKIFGNIKTISYIYYVIKMRDMKTKMKFNYAGMICEVPSECLITKSHWGEPLETPFIRIGRKEVASICKQFVKKNFPNLLVWASSQTFANGNSVSIDVCNADGSDLDRGSVEWNKISSFVNSLSGGRYNGYDDIYEYGTGNVTENGTKIESYAKYVSCNNTAPHGSWPSAVKTLKGLVAGEYVFGVLSLEKAIEKAKGYGYSESNIEKALKLI